MLMKWVDLKKELPDPAKHKLVLGYDYDDIRKWERFLICESDSPYSDNSLHVYKSICPPIGARRYSNAHWMALPENDESPWIKFEFNEDRILPEGFPDSSTKIITRLHVGSMYVATVNSFVISPTFSFTKYCETECLNYWMPLPKSPK